MTPALLKPERTWDKTNVQIRAVPSRLSRIGAAPSLTVLNRLCTQIRRTPDYLLSQSVVTNIPVYDLARHTAADADTVSLLCDEWKDILLSGPGVIWLKNFVPRTALIDRLNSAFNEIISSEASSVNGDHLNSGKNSRIWNSFQKHALQDPFSFVEYYSNPWLARVCEAWLGPAYQVTAQLDIVWPGVEPQLAHRDYHLGSQGTDQCARFPKAIQIARQLLTLQGEIAHSDMPLESGPTRFLPFSQLFPDGFMAFRRPEFKKYFEDNWVSLPLEQGDAVFFNPAIFHAAGENQSRLDKSTNLLQISSALGKPMESFNRLAILQERWTCLREMHNAGDGEQDINALIRAICPGYPFPTNLDRRSPAAGPMAPESEADIISKAL